MSVFTCYLFKKKTQPRFETVVSELILVKNEALHAINNLKKWMQPQHVERNLVSLVWPFPTSSLGLVLRNLLGANSPSHSYKAMHCSGPAEAD